MKVYWVCLECGARIIQWREEVDADSEANVEYHEFFTHQIGNPKVIDWE